MNCIRDASGDRNARSGEEGREAAASAAVGGGGAPSPARPAAVSTLSRASSAGGPLPEGRGPRDLAHAAALEVARRLDDLPRRCSSRTARSGRPAPRAGRRRAAAAAPARRRPGSRTASPAPEQRHLAVLDGGPRVADLRPPPRTRRRGPGGRAAAEPPRPRSGSERPVLVDDGGVGVDHRPGAERLAGDHPAPAPGRRRSARAGCSLPGTSWYRGRVIFRRAGRFTQIWKPCTRPPWSRIRCDGISE